MVSNWRAQVKKGLWNMVSSLVIVLSLLPQGTTLGYQRLLADLDMLVLRTLLGPLGPKIEIFRPYVSALRPA